MDASGTNSSRPPRGKFECREVFSKNIPKMGNTSVSSENLLDDVGEADFAGVTLTLSPLPEAGIVSSRRLLHQDQPGVLTSTSCTFVFVFMGLIFIALFLLAEFYVWVQKDIHLLLLRRGD